MNEAAGAEYTWTQDGSWLPHRYTEEPPSMYDYDALEEQLGSVISSPAGWLTPDETREVREFIEVREYGLAYETLCDIITEGNKTIPPDTYDQLVALGRQMEFEEEVWTKLLPYVKE